MKVKGDEFIRNLEIEKEKVKLQEQANSLDTKKQKSIFHPTLEEDENNKKEDVVFQDLDDIALNNTPNKQKYIVFGFALILLFLITIIIIKLLQDPKPQNDFTTDNLIEDLDQKTLQQTTKKIDKTLDIDKIIQSEVPIKTKQKENIDKKQKEHTKGDIFGIEKKPSIKETKPEKETIKKETIKKKIVKKDIKIKRTKPIINKPVKQINLDELFKNKKTKKVSNKPQGYYIQVGAFVKAPDKKIINTLKKAKYNFILHKMKIKGRLFTKVLVGSYPTKKLAKKNLKKVRDTIHNNSAYILRFR
jgi:DedD protein